MDYGFDCSDMMCMWYGRNGRLWNPPSSLLTSHLPSLYDLRERDASYTEVSCRRVFCLCLVVLVAVVTDPCTAATSDCPHTSHTTLSTSPAPRPTHQAQKTLLVNPRASLSVHVYGNLAVLVRLSAGGGGSCEWRRVGCQGDSATPIVYDVACDVTTNTHSPEECVVILSEAVPATTTTTKMVGTKTTKTVTVQKKGTFSDDPFFKDSWQEWDQAMKDVVDRWDKNTSKTTTTTTTSSSRPDTRNVYRQIRSSNVTSDDSQAVSCTEEDDKYKMMIDVKDFKPEDINVKVIDDTVVVEGKIEKKEGNAVSTQMFTRRFMLPPTVNLNLLASALSRDGVLTINAPKLEVTPGIGSRRVSIVHGDRSGAGSSYPAGAPSQKRGGDDKRYLSHTPLNSGEDTKVAPVSETSRDHWTSFNDMVEKSQKEMEDMMRRHSLQSSTTITTSPHSTSLEVAAPPSSLSRPPAGVISTHDVTKSGNNVTERQEQRWQDKPAPGLNRTNRMLNEKTEMKAADGTVVGNKKRHEQESQAEGSNEETLPDGTKKKTFTKSYETRKVYSYNSSDPKAV
ncbi:hypothetical protein Pcinc_018958 [Petrolisthes cinctipes]|uniref:SHSP domain-containing protein n=1 Tax=Petrolisthes cinctipes TaxID=88211 RepID=A0AAE1FN57_PETCI|nr:hypothetical protein Pcinc_018958 [Petrolisthes cinctipes]